jgi:hypothetical protein
MWQTLVSADEVTTFRWSFSCVACVSMHTVRAHTRTRRLSRPLTDLVCVSKCEDFKYNRERIKVTMREDLSKIRP